MCYVAAAVSSQALNENFGYVVQSLDLVSSLDLASSLDSTNSSLDLKYPPYLEGW